ncbi:MAG: sodium-dependent transporter [Pseudomonadales bacterium]
MTAGATEQFSSRFGFLMASIGFAVGLGNIWRFPYVTGENGGGAFVLVYLLCAFGIGVPILMAEILVGRRGRASPPGAMRNVAVAEGCSPGWRWVGGLNLMTAFLILVTYTVVVGWVLRYLFSAVGTGFAMVDGSAAAAAYSGMLADAGGLLFWTVLSLALAGGIVYAGVQNGIERSVRVLMPTLFLLLIALALYNVASDGFGAAVDYLFTPDFSKVNGAMLLAAVGQAFFSIGVAMAGMMTFGAYLPRQHSIASSVVIIIAADTLVALVAGLAIFPVVFNYGLDPAGGPGLIFQTLPVAFAQMPGGHLVSVLFFVLLAVGGITSMVGLMEPIVAWLDEHRGLARHRSTLGLMAAISVLSLLAILSYNLLAHWKLGSRAMGDALDYLSNQMMLPLGGLLIALFVGWRVSRASVREELGMRSATLFSLWHVLIRYAAPLAVAVILITGLG